MTRSQKTPRWTRLGLLTAILASSGCYSYALIQPDAVAPGDGVRVLVTRQGAVELAEVTEVAWEQPIFDGTVLGVEDDDLLLQVPVGERQVGFLSSQLHQTVRVPTSEIVSFQRRQLNTTTTALAIGGAAGLATLLVVYIVSEHRSGQGNGEPPPPDDLLLRFNLLSFPFGR